MNNNIPSSLWGQYNTVTFRFNGNLEWQPTPPGSDWNKLQAFQGTADDNAGYDVHLSKDGLYFALAALGTDGPAGSNVGSTRAFELYDLSADVSNIC